MYEHINVKMYRELIYKLMNEGIDLSLTSLPQEIEIKDEFSNRRECE
mgnify:CR=1 FL=1